MKTFYIIITTVVFSAISWTPQPCNVPQVFTYQVKTDTVFSDTCRPCADQVQQAASQQINKLQLDQSGAWYISSVKRDSISE